MTLATPLRRGGLIVLAIGWVAAVSAWGLASVPDPAVPLHSFERTPVPGMVGAAVATAVATAFVILRRGEGSFLLRLIATAVLYLVVDVLVVLGVLFIYMG